MMLDGYIAKDKSGIFCFHVEEPEYVDGTWVSDDAATFAMQPEDVPEELKEMEYLDSPVKYRLFVSVTLSHEL